MYNQSFLASASVSLFEQVVGGKGAEGIAQGRKVEVQFFGITRIQKRLIGLLEAGVIHIVPFKLEEEQGG